MSRKVESENHGQDEYFEPTSPRVREFTGAVSGATVEPVALATVAYTYGDSHEANLAGHGPSPTQGGE